jgi:arginine/lysine/ornithine decarboxylase
MAQGKSGRPTNLPDRPATAAQRFCWMVRMHRSYSPHDDIRTAADVARRMNQIPGIEATSDRVNRFETGTARFALDEIAAYESAVKVVHLLFG